MKRNIQNEIEQLRITGKWFWADDFVSPHVNPQLRQLVDTYKEVLDTIRLSKPKNVVAKLLELSINTSLIVKHIMILLDVSAESLDRASMFIYEKGYKGLTLSSGETVPFHSLGIEKYRDLKNENIAKAGPGLRRDLLNILTFAAISDEFGAFETFKNCNLCEICGDEGKLNEHLLYLSLKSNSQIKQLRAVDFGTQLQQSIRNYLSPHMKPLGVVYAPSSRYNGQSFDLVLQKGDKHMVIEVAFQETTNSTLERKGKQAKNGLFNSIDLNGDKLVYVVDGAGYFKRKKALTDLATNSHLICNVSSQGLSRLKDFMYDYFK